MRTILPLSDEVPQDIGVEFVIGFELVLLLVGVPDSDVDVLSAVIEPQFLQLLGEVFFAGDGEEEVIELLILGDLHDLLAVDLGGW